MKVTELKVSRIGNSKGIRIPAEILKRYGISDTVLLEERANELALIIKRDQKLSWKDTFAEMAREKEDWSAFDATAADGLEE
jgi:antitoxin component of MazEF toxin-antitoxin module